MAAISRCLATIYAVSMLTALVKIELNIIGAHLFIENSADDLSVLQSQRQYFVKNELYRLIEKIEAFTEEVFRK